MTTVGFVGLGNMGAPMARNLVQAGFQVRGFDVAEQAKTAAARSGITICNRAAETVEGARYVITMLPRGSMVLDVYREVLPAASAGTMFIDCSTISVAEARQAHAAATEAGHRAADAPVSGGVVGATAGTLAFMVGATDEDFETVRPLLEPMAGRVVHCGRPGNGQAAKVCNNLILAISTIGVSEAFVLGERLGLTHQALFDVASNASGQCWALTTNCPVPGPVPTSPANRDYQPGFAAALMLKDLGLAIDAIAQTGTDAQLGTLSARMYRDYVEDGGGGTDFSGIIHSIRANTATGKETQ